jgi:hypothetical protein
MDHVICVNQNSFPAENTKSGTQLFEDALQGVLELQGTSDRFLFYLDSNNGNLFDFEIAINFTYQQFIETCGDNDLALFLSEVEDKSPALDSLSEEQIEEMAANNFYVPNEGIDDYPDVYALAWAVSGYLLSIATHGRWSNGTINIARTDDQGRYINEFLTLKNISSQAHGLAHYQAFNEVDLKMLLSPHIISEPLLLWFSQQTPENKTRIIDKTRLAYNRKFDGGEPLFKTLIDGDGLREIRMSAYAGGAIRILFKPFKEQTQALLFGFIKHNNSEGYKIAIKQSHKIYSDLSRVITPKKE